MRHGPFSSPLHHVSYLVGDLEQAIGYSVDALGAGPFFVFRDVPLEATSEGEPVAFAHSAAFGQWGSSSIELMQIHSCDSARVEASMTQSMPAISHLAWAVPSLESASEMLTGAGLPAFLRARVGEIDFVVHDARQLYGHNVELHADSEGFRAFFRQVLDASIDWDGRDPVRELNS